MLDVARQLIWFAASVFLVLTFAMVLIVGPDILDGTAARVAVASALLVWIAQGYAMHRHRSDVERDPGVHHARERRGF